MKKLAFLCFICLASGGMFACTKLVKPTESTAPATATMSCDCPDGKQVETIPPVQLPESSKDAASSAPPLAVKEPSKIADYSLLKLVSWEEVEGLKQGEMRLAWPAWLQSCSALAARPVWQKVCGVAQDINRETAGTPSDPIVQDYFKQYFSVYKTTNADGTDHGLITGYYEPILKGSREKSTKYPYPLYTPPSDLITVELSSLHPELKFKRVRGRLVGNKLVPYYNRADIETEMSPIQGHEFIYIDDIIDVFFLQIQGSGLVQLETGEQVHVGYADQNGHGYNSIGRLLIEQGELTAANASMQGIKNWARNNLGKLRTLLNNNPSYVFFRELPADLPGPLGALGVPILGERSVAIDPKFVPLGAPIFLSTTEPNSTKPLKRMMMAQDTGGAIKGGVRADFFWGAGVKAGTKAGAMKQAGKIWVFLPKEFALK